MSDLMILAVPIAIVAVLAIRDLPVFGILSILLVARVATDGAFNVPVGGSNVSGVAGLAILALAVASGLRSWKSFFVFLGIGAALYASMLQAIATVPGAVDEYLRVMSVIGVWVIVKNLRKAPAPSSVVNLVQVVALFSAIPGIFQALTGTGKLVEGVLRPAGTMQHPNSAALVYAIGIVISIASFLYFGRKRRDIVIATTLAVAILLTGSMGGMVALAVMLLSLVVLAPRIGIRAKVGTLLLTAMAIAVFVVSPLGAERLSELNNLDLSGSTGEKNSLEWRVGRWRTLIAFWSESPLSGRGLGSATGGSLLGGYAPHNEYLRLLVELGIVGAIVVALIALPLGIALWRRSRGGSVYAPIASVALAVAIGLAVNAAAENTFMYSVVGYLLALISAFAMTTVPPSATVDGPTGAHLVEQNHGEWRGRDA